MHLTPLPIVPRFISSIPKRMFTSSLSFRNAALLTLLCMPPLLLFAATCLPSLIFNSPDQNAYFYFARGLNHDLTGSVSLWMAALCLILALALPAPRVAMPDKIRH